MMARIRSVVVWAGSETGLQWGLRDLFGEEEMFHVFGGFIGRSEHHGFL